MRVIPHGNFQSVKELTLAALGTQYATRGGIAQGLEKKIKCNGVGSFYFPFSNDADECMIHHGVKCVLVGENVEDLDFRRMYATGTIALTLLERTVQRHPIFSTHFKTLKIDGGHNSHKYELNKPSIDPTCFKTVKDATRLMAEHCESSAFSCIKGNHAEILSDLMGCLMIVGECHDGLRQVAAAFMFDWRPSLPVPMTPSMFYKTLRDGDTLHLDEILYKLLCRYYNLCDLHVPAIKEAIRNTPAASSSMKDMLICVAELGKDDNKERGEIVRRFVFEEGWAADYLVAIMSGTHDRMGRESKLFLIETGIVRQVAENVISGAEEGIVWGDVRAGLFGRAGATLCSRQ